MGLYIYITGSTEKSFHYGHYHAVVLLRNYVCCPLICLQKCFPKALEILCHLCHENHCRQLIRQHYQPQTLNSRRVQSSKYPYCHHVLQRMNSLLDWSRNTTWASTNHEPCFMQRDRFACESHMAMYLRRGRIRANTNALVTGKSKFYNCVMQIAYS